MIARVLVLSRQEVERCIADTTGKFAITCPWDLISIYGQHRLIRDDNNHKLSHCHNVLSLHFSDISREEYDSIKAYENEQTKRLKEQIIVFDRGHAKKVIDFVTKLQIEPQKRLLVVHCHAGISRSGAVGLFINRYLKLNDKLFRQDNPYILPNAYILSTLMEMSGLNDDYEAWWAGHIPLDQRIMF